MQAVYEDISMDLSKMLCSENDHFTTGTADDVYVNTENFHPKPKEWTDISAHGKLKDNKKTAKIFILILGLLVMLGVLTLCVLGTLYHHKMVSYELLSEQHDNVTKTLMIQKQKAKDTERLYKELKSKNQDLISTCNETDRLYKELKPKNQELISSYSETKLQYEMLKVKHQQVNERLSACTANQNCKSCGEGWKSLGIKCYYFSTDKQIWTQSRDYCVSKGGHLVIITSQTEQHFAYLQIEETHWIGLNDLETEGKWMWVNNQPLTETGVMFWFSRSDNPDEPDNWKNEDSSGENCAALGDEYGHIDKWFDASCQKRKRYICEKYL